MEHTKSFGIVTVMVVMCAYTDMESVAHRSPLGVRSHMAKCIKYSKKNLEP